MNGKIKLRIQQKKDTITTENIKYMKEHSKITKYFNTLMIKKLKPDRTNFRNKWNELLSTTIDEQRWKYIYKQVFSLTDDTLLKMFQYKIINNIQYTNDKLFKWNIIETELCTFCNETKETMCHLIWECRHSKTIWLRFRDIIEQKLCITFDLNLVNILFNVYDDDYSDPINLCILLIKKFLFNCRYNTILPNFDNVAKYILHYK